MASRLSGGAGTQRDPIFLDDYDVPEHGNVISDAVRQDAIVISSDEEDNMNVDASGTHRDGEIHKNSDRPQKASSSTIHTETVARDEGLQSNANDHLANHDQKPNPLPPGSKSLQGHTPLSTSGREEAHTESNDDMSIPTLRGLSDMVGHKPSPMLPFNHQSSFSNHSPHSTGTYEREISHASNKASQDIPVRTKTHGLPTINSQRSGGHAKKDDEVAPVSRCIAAKDLLAAKDKRPHDLNTEQHTEHRGVNLGSVNNTATPPKHASLGASESSVTRTLEVKGDARSDSIEAAMFERAQADHRSQESLASPVSTAARTPQRARKTVPPRAARKSVPESGNGGDSNRRSRTTRDLQKQERKRLLAERRSQESSMKTAKPWSSGRLRNDIQQKDDQFPLRSTSGSPAIMPTEPQPEQDGPRPEREIEAESSPLPHSHPKNIATVLQNLLRLAYEDHEYMTSALLRQQRTCRERERRARKYTRDGPTPPALPEKYVQHESPFNNLQPLQTRVPKGKEKEQISSELRDFSEDVEPKANSKGKKGRKENPNKALFTVPRFKYKSDAVTIPPFTEFVHLKQTLLGENHSKLLVVQSDMDEGLDDLIDNYELLFDNKPYLDLRKEQTRFYKRALTEFLTRISISLNHITYWLLTSEVELNAFRAPDFDSLSFEKMLKERSEYDIETFMHGKEKKDVRLFSRRSEKWREFKQSLERPSLEKLMIAARACGLVFKECGFSFWYLAVQSPGIHGLHERKLELQTRPVASHIQDMRCRVCHQHKCIAHGEVRQEPMSDSDSEVPTEPAHWHPDLSLEKVINYRVPANSSSNAYNKPPNHEHDEITKLVEWEKYEPFIPCSHEGSCDTAACRCWVEEVNCEKACKCAMSCSNRFPGCACRKGPNKRPCERNSNCLCAKNNRECDPDLCQKCEASEVLDRVNRYNDEISLECCGNVPIQRGLPKKTLIGTSEVHGFGLFSGEDFKRHDFVGEYLGEQISAQEADRRATRDGYKATQYAFDVNRAQTSDSTYMGNNFRFINNASEAGANLYSKSILCNTVLRIAFYAKHDIKAGTELFFTYNYAKEQMAQFKEPKAQRAVAVKQSKKGKGPAGGRMLQQLRIDESARTTRTQKSARAFQSQSTSQSTQESKSSLVLPPDDDEDDEDFDPGDVQRDPDADDESEAGSTSSASQPDPSPPRRNMRREKASEKARQRAQNKTTESKKSRNRKRGFAGSDEE